MATNRLRQIEARGQSVWQDYITREQLKDGGLRKLVEEDGISGVTTNPSIFQKAIGGAADYDSAIAALGRQGKNVAAILDTLIIEDVQGAADVFRPVWEQTGARDGFVSIEVGANLARDTSGTIAEAHRLWDAVNRPNVLVKIPGTVEGVPAIKQCLIDGLNINVTLLFSLAHYEAVAQAFIEALETRVQAGKPVDQLASVASFFVSRVDTIVDNAVEAKVKTETDPTIRARLQDLIGNIAVDNARVAYARFEELFSPSTERFQKLVNRGAQPQRPLWASTSMKNPKRSDVLYVEELIAPLTVNTMPPATIDAFRDHGEVHGDTARDDLAGTRRRLGALGELGIDFDGLTAKLEVDGIKQFADAYDALVASASEKLAKLQVSRP
ncbi:MAG TPA: transaldolase [Chloroflexota bacterium]|nr:transaldolase [Chloroflexota bacterium]